MSNQELERRQQRCAKILGERGLDQIVWFTVGALNDRLEPEHRLPGSDDALGLLVGNSKALWEPFVRFMHQTKFSQTGHPLDLYVERSVVEASDEIATPSWLRFAHQLIPEPIPIQRYAQAAGLARISPAHLCVHPIHGPWIALRAVAVFPKTACSQAMPRIDAPCEGCDAPCQAAFARALRGDLPSPRTPPVDLSEESRLLLAARDACPIGQASRYSDDQLRYHYDKNFRPS